MLKIMEKTNLKFIWALLCQSVTVDSQTNNISLFNIIEQLTVNINLPENAPNIPKEVTIPAQMVLVTYWKNLSEDKELETEGKVILKDPSGAVLGDNSFKFKFTQGGPSLRFFVNMNGLKLTTAGNYTFSILAKQNDGDTFKEMGCYDFNINLTKGKAATKVNNNN